MRHLWTWFGLLAALALLAAACGDDTLSDEAYFEALADIGADSDAAAEPLFAPFAGDESGSAVLRAGAEAAVAFLDGFQALFVVARADTAALAPPSDLAAAHDAVVAAMDEVIDELEEARAQVAGGADVETIFEHPQPAAAFDEWRRACATLQQLAADRGFELELSCVEE